MCEVGFFVTNKSKIIFAHPEVAVHLLARITIRRELPETTFDESAIVSHVFPILWRIAWCFCDNRILS